MACFNAYSGYYIHGRSAHGVADTNLKVLNENLKKEQADVAPKRGLEGGDYQGFEMIMSQHFRDTFNKIYNLISNIQRRRLPALRLGTSAALIKVALVETRLRLQ